jgi:hypothetical protein
VHIPMPKKLAVAQTKLSDEWNVSEVYLKIAEQVSSEAVIPGINELRYAGRKVLEAQSLEASDPERSLRLLHDALHDCYRARHDCIDVSVSLINRHIEIMIDRLGYSKLVTALPDLGELIAALSSAQEKIASSRSRRLAREEIYIDIKDIDLPLIRKKYDAIRASEPMIKLEVARENRNKTLNMAFTVAGVLIGLVALAISVF